MTSFVAMMEIETLSEWTYMNFGEEARKDAADYPSGMGGRTILLSLALFLGTILLYAPGIRNGFVSLDDPDYVTRNAHVQQGLSLNNVKWAFGTDNPGSNWHPLTWISHMLDVDWYDGRPYGHHLTSILLQAIDVSLLFLLLACATGETLRSASVAALFAVHPLNVEAVAWVAERKSVLCMLFFLATLGAYGWYAKKPVVGRYILTLACFALALLSKVMVVTLPAALFLMDFWPLGRVQNAGIGRGGHVKLILEKVPLLLMSVGASATTLYVHAREHALAKGMPHSWLLKNGIYSYVVYLGKMIWPVRLAAFYPHPENSLSWTVVMLCGLVLAGISVIVWKYRARKYLVVGWLWFLGTMFPMVGFIQSGRQGMADRYMYIPMIGLLVGLVWLIGDLASEKNWNAGVPSLLVLLAIAPCAYLTETQIAYWHDSYTLFAHTLAVTSNNGLAENNYGSALFERGKPEEAMKHFEAAVKYSPDLAAAHYNLGMMWQRENRAADAEQEYKKTLKLSNDSLELAQAHNNLGVLYLQAHLYPAARAEFDAAIRLNESEYNSYLSRGTIELEEHDYDRAAADFMQATQIAPVPRTFFLLGNALEAKGDKQRAAEAYAAALQMAPGFEEAKAKLTALRAASGTAK